MFIPSAQHCTCSASQLLGSFHSCPAMQLLISSHSCSSSFHSCQCCTYSAASCSGPQLLSSFNLLHPPHRVSCYDASHPKHQQPSNCQPFLLRHLRARRPWVGGLYDVTPQIVACVGRQPRLGLSLESAAPYSPINSVVWKSNKQVQRTWPLLPESSIRNPISDAHASSSRAPVVHTHAS